MTDINTIANKYACTKCHATHNSIPQDQVFGGKTYKGECGKCTCHTGTEEPTFIPSVYNKPDGTTKTYYRERQCNNRCRNTMFRELNPSEDKARHGLVVTNNYMGVETPEHGKEVWLEGYRSKHVGEDAKGNPKFIRLKIRVLDLGTRYRVKELKLVNGKKQWVEVGINFDVKKVLDKGTWLKVSSVEVK